MAKPAVALTLLDPHWVEADGLVMGVAFNCPEHMGPDQPDGYCRQVVPFTPSMEGKPTKTWQKNGHTWQREGGKYTLGKSELSDFENLSLSPSVRAGCGWHGFITKGIVTCCPDSK